MTRYQCGSIAIRLYFEEYRTLAHVMAASAATIPSTSTCVPKIATIRCCTCVLALSTEELDRRSFQSWRLYSFLSVLRHSQHKYFLHFLDDFTGIIASSKHPCTCTFCTLFTSHEARYQLASTIAVPKQNSKWFIETYSSLIPTLRTN